jgi:selenocysteine lyase/cysteine desulfurase
MDSNRRAFLHASGFSALSTLAVAASDIDDPLGVRKDFPATRDHTFLNTAYIGLTPQPVVEGARDWVEARARHYYTVGQMEHKKHETRQLFAELVGADEDEIGFLFRRLRVKT